MLLGLGTSSIIQGGKSRNEAGPFIAGVEDDLNTKLNDFLGRKD